MKLDFEGNDFLNEIQRKWVALQFMVYSCLSSIDSLDTKKNGFLFDIDDFPFVRCKCIITGLDFEIRVSLTTFRIYDKSGLLVFSIQNESNGNTLLQFKNMYTHEEFRYFVSVQNKTLSNIIYIGEDIYCEIVPSKDTLAIMINNEIHLRLIVDKTITASTTSQSDI